MFCSLSQGTYAPSSTDSGSTGSLVNDVYWGALRGAKCHQLPLQRVLALSQVLLATHQCNGPRVNCTHTWAGMELYPRIGKQFDLKTWTNCRMGMMGWAVIILCYAAKQAQAHGAVADSLLVSVALMQIYIAKFFLCGS